MCPRLFTVIIITIRITKTIVVTIILINKKDNTTALG